MGEMIEVLAIYGSPRRGGNTDALLDHVLEGVESAGARVDRLYVRELRFEACVECGGCDATGRCVLSDEMQAVYPRFDACRVVLLAAPMFFYGFPARAKALVDRCQAAYMGRLLRKKGEAAKRFDGGTGYLLSVGATRGKRLFEGAELAAKYFFWAMDKNYGGGLFYRRIEEKGDILRHPEILEEARAFGVRVVEAEA